MDPKECLTEVERLIDKARAMRVSSREEGQAKAAIFTQALERLEDYLAWRSDGGFEPTFPDATGDVWAEHFRDVLASYGIK